MQKWTRYIQTLPFRAYRCMEVLEGMRDGSFFSGTVRRPGGGLVRCVSFLISFLRCVFSLQVIRVSFCTVSNQLKLHRVLAFLF